MVWGEHLSQIGLSNEMKHVDAFENAYAIKNDIDNWREKGSRNAKEWTIVKVWLLISS